MSTQAALINLTTIQGSVAVTTYASDGAFVAAKGSAAADGDLYYNTTLGAVRVYQGGWHFLKTAVILSYASDAAFVTAKNSAAANGDLYYNTTENALRCYQNSAWHFVKTAALLSYATTSAYVTGKGSAAANGDLFYESTEHTFKGYHNSAWHFLKAGCLVSYASDAAYVTAKGSAAAEGDGYYNSTLDMFRVYANSAWTSLITTNFGWQNMLYNFSLSASVGSSALTVAIKTKAGNDPSATDPVYIAFRNSTVTNGTWEIVEVTAATSVVASSGSTLGLSSSSVAEKVYPYAINNGGTVVLGLVGGAPILNEKDLHSSTAEGGAGAADTRYTLYSTAAQTTKPVRLLGELEFSLATAGTWNEVPDKIALAPLMLPFAIRSSVTLWGTNGHGSSSTTIRRYTNSQVVGAAMSYADSGTLGGIVTILEEGLYAFGVSDTRSGASFGIGVSANSTQLTTAINSINDYHGAGEGRLISTNNAAGLLAYCGSQERFKPGDLIRVHDDGNLDGTSNAQKFRIVKIGP